MKNEKVTEFDVDVTRTEKKGATFTVSATSTSDANAKALAEAEDYDWYTCAYTDWVDLNVPSITNVVDEIREWPTGD